MRFLLIIFLCFINVHATAQEIAEEISPHYPTLTPSQNDLKKTSTANVVTVIDALRVQLDDKRIIQLIGLDIPDLLQQEPGAYSLHAMNLLKSHFLGRKINIYQAPDTRIPRQNRMGYTTAHIARADNDIWAQGLLLYERVARVRTTTDHVEMATDLYNIEDAARTRIDPPGGTSQLNIWNDPQYHILNTETVENAQQGYQIVEGAIKSVATHDNRIYLNFGDNWRTDFTISIDPQARRRFSKEGLAPLQWAGHNVRVRGWLESYNGPYINIDHPQQIAFITQEQSGTANHTAEKLAKEEKVKDNALPDHEKY